MFKRLKGGNVLRFKEERTETLTLEDRDLEGDVIGFYGLGRKEEREVRRENGIDFL